MSRMRSAGFLRHIFSRTVSAESAVYFCREEVFALITTQNGDAALVPLQDACAALRRCLTGAAVNTVHRPPVFGKSPAGAASVARLCWLNLLRASRHVDCLAAFGPPFG
jgi:hypothetical protein